MPCDSESDTMLRAFLTAFSGEPVLFNDVVLDFTDRRSSPSPPFVNARGPPPPGPPNPPLFDEYADEIASFLAKHPKTNMAALGGRVKKPKNMMMKVKEFLLTHKDRFVIEGEFVSNRE